MKTHDISWVFITFITFYRTFMNNWFNFLISNAKMYKIASL